MNKFNFVAIMGIVAVLSLSLGSAAPVLAQDNMSMTMDNMTSDNMSMTMDNMTSDNGTMMTINEIPSENTSMLSETDMGLDGNELAGQQ